MKFLIDAQLPFDLKKNTVRKGFDFIHTDDLPNKELSSDIEIIKFTSASNRVIITKDSDFVDSHFLKSSLQKLLIVTT